MTIANDKGFTLMEIMISLGLMGLTLLILMVPHIEIQKSFKQSESKVARILENQNLQQQITGSDFSLDKSAQVSPSNDLLCPCAMGGKMKVGGTNLCANSLCTANVATEFYFFDPQVKDLITLAGTSVAPVYYSANGARCKYTTNPNTECAYKSLASFTAHCPENLAQCDHADYLTVELVLTPTPGHALAETKKKFIYPIKLNYPPVLSVISNQTLQMSLATKIAVNANAGDPTEAQNFVFEKCDSSDTNIVDVKCYRFINSVGQMILTPKSPGVATITLQVNDGGVINSLSNMMSFSTTVNP